MKKSDLIDQRDISILRAHAVAAALRKAKPSGPGPFPPSQDALVTWHECCRQLTAVVCTADGVSISVFYDLCGVSEEQIT